MQQGGRGKKKTDVQRSEACREDANTNTLDGGYGARGGPNSLSRQSIRHRKGLSVSSVCALVYSDFIKEGREVQFTSSCIVPPSLVVSCLAATIPATTEE